MKPSHILLGLIVLSILGSLGMIAVFWERLPDVVVSHWNMYGEADGYMPKLWGMLLFPIFLVVVDVLTLVLPKIDPMKNNLKGFQNWFYGFILVLNLFFLVLQVQVILWSLGTQISPNLIVPVLMGGLFVYVGLMLDKVKQNWFIGIKTPWTLSSELVWDKTHKLGAKFFIAVGVCSVLSVLFADWAFLVVIGLVIVSSLYLVLFSYLEYRKEK
jgi:uncharacterized membrane protein